MANWTFYDYIEPSGANPIAEWLATLPVDVQAHVDNKLLYLEQRPQWNEKLFKKYQGRDGIYEVLITFKKVEYRPLVCKHPLDARGFVLLVGTIEQNWKLKPASALKTAEERRDALKKDPYRAKLHKF